MASFNWKIENRNKLYFKKYKYRGRVKLHGVSYTRFCKDEAEVRKRINMYKNSTFYNRNGERTNFWENVNVNSLIEFVDWEDSCKDKDMSIRIESSVISIFSNNRSDITSIASCSFVEKESLDLTEIVVHNTEQNTMFFKKEPKYKYRTYFKKGIVTKDFYDSVNNAIDTYSDIKVCNGLIRKMSARNPFPSSYLWSDYFIDYNDNKMETIFHLLFGSMISKSYSLQKYP